MKKLIYHRDFDQKNSKYSSFLVQTLKTLKACFFFLCSVGIIHQMLIILHFLQISDDFLQNFQELSSHFL